MHSGWQLNVLAPATVLRYETLACKFLEGRVSLDDELGLQGLDGQHVAAFLLGECTRLSLGSAKEGSPSCGRC